MNALKAAVLLAKVRRAQLDFAWTWLLNESDPTVRNVLQGGWTVHNGHIVLPKRTFRSGGLMQFVPLGGIRAE